MSAPRGESGRAGDNDEPVPVSKALTDVGAELGLPESGALEKLRAHWDEIVGAPLAGHARLGAVRAGVLTVIVDAAPWATRLRYLVPDVTRATEELAGPGVVSEVRIRVQRPS